MEKPQTHYDGLKLFLKELFLHPRDVGAAFPSSKSLAKKLVEPIDIQKPGLVIELGAGTGAVTQALVDQIPIHENLLVIEHSVELVNFLKKQFPQLNILQADAAELSRTLNDYPKEINAIVSSLPLQSLPTKIVSKFIQQLENILQKDSLFIQFTYHYFSDYPFLSESEHFRRIHSEIVWYNFPPARVDVFQKVDR